MEIGTGVMFWTILVGFVAIWTVIGRFISIDFSFIFHGWMLLTLPVAVVVFAFLGSQ